jgi:hypothetical protein
MLSIARCSLNEPPRGKCFLFLSSFLIDLFYAVATIERSWHDRNVDIAAVEVDNTALVQGSGSRVEALFLSVSSPLPSVPLGHLLLPPTQTLTSNPQPPISIP